ncbi:hypothetical protein RJ639_010726 [Escallonia herrerae]|uniref:DYW domain-containing protein n=1 Tax=Escallonia herrerae TaxID=1293975 RepID=A0AA89APH0_9ASTE|nr:hypothetical protein RJ639_010726 [Escallonia herrerae]
MANYPSNSFTYTQQVQNNRIFSRWRLERCLQAMSLGKLSRMVEEGIELSDFTLTSVDNACRLLVEKKTNQGTMTVDEVASAAVHGVCGMLGFRVIGQQIHCHSLKSGFMSDIGVGNATINGYCKCGNLKDGIKVFKIMPRHDVVSWNGLMAGHILHRQGDKTLAFWMQMVVAGHWALLEEAGQEICMMPREPEASVWRALLDSCRVNLNTAVGKQAAKQILAMEPQNPSTQAGYMPDTSFVLHEVEEHQKKTEFLFYRSVKLAITYGLLMTRPGKPVRLMKNIVL